MKKTIFTLISLLFLTSTMFAQHGWVKVNHIQSTIFTGVVTFNGQPADEDDVVGVFVDGECRMVADIILRDGVSYVSSVLHGTTVENASIKFYRASEDKIYDVDTTIITKPGGEINLFPIDIISTPPVATSIAGLNEINLKVYPTPFDDQLFLKSDHNITKVVIYNNIGQDVVVAKNINEKSIVIETESFDVGVFFITIEFEEGTVVTKRLFKH